MGLSRYRMVFPDISDGLLARIAAIRLIGIWSSVLRKRSTSGDGEPGARLVNARNKNESMNAILLSALMAVETGGERNPDLAIGDGGRAIGCLQIHRAVVLDVNRIAGTHYTHDQMTNRVAASRVCEIYLDHYGKGLDDISRARVWNGGPRGHLRGSTRAYGLRVRGAIRDLENRTVNESFTVAGKTKRKTK
jgi:hypothetical protein